MGIENYLIEGGSGTGKTTVAEELQKRGYHVIHGDRELAFIGDPQTGKIIKEPDHDNEWSKNVWRQKHYIWDLGKVTNIIKDHSTPVSFFCGGSRNSHQFIDLFDDVFILEVKDIEIINQRLDERVARDPTDFGGTEAEKKLIAQLHETKRNFPKNGTVIDSTAPIEEVVNKILEMVS